MLDNEDGGFVIRKFVGNMSLIGYHMQIRGDFITQYRANGTVPPISTGVEQ